MGSTELVLLTLGLGFGLGAGMILAAGMARGTRSKARELWALYASEFLIVAALVIPAALGRGFFALALAAFLLRAGWELFRVMGRPGRAALLFLGLAMLTAMIDAVRAGPGGFLWIFAVFATVEIADAFALVCGKLFGRTKIFPRLSPRKTAQGLIGGFLLGGVAGYLLGVHLLIVPRTEAAILALLLLGAGLAGDLLTSALKRARGVKDFPHLLARHGGILDIYDSFLFAAPAAYAFRLVTGL